jgi:hypothetical protein
VRFPSKGCRFAPLFPVSPSRVESRVCSPSKTVEVDHAAAFPRGLARVSSFGPASSRRALFGADGLRSVRPVRVSPSSHVPWIRVDSRSAFSPSPRARFASRASCTRRSCGLCEAVTCEPVFGARRGERSDLRSRREALDRRVALLGRFCLKTASLPTPMTSTSDQS